MPEIKIACKGHASVPYTALTPFQGNLKDLPKFKSILERVIVSSACEVWQFNDHFNAKFKRPKYQDRDGYYRVWLKDSQHRRGVKFIPIHRLIAVTFLHKPSENHVVNHKNGIRTDNRLINLEWVTPADNERHARKVLGKRCVGAKCSQSKLSEKEVLAIRTAHEKGDVKLNQLAVCFNISEAQVGRIVRRENWSHV